VAERLGAQREVKRTVAPNIISLARGQDGTEPNVKLTGVQQRAAIGPE
jgi:hypothetical protein